jgi:hypothetical protein
MRTSAKATPVARNFQTDFAGARFGDIFFDEFEYLGTAVGGDDNAGVFHGRLFNVGKPREAAGYRLTTVVDIQRRGLLRGETGRCFAFFEFRAHRPHVF